MPAAPLFGDGCAVVIGLRRLGSALPHPLPFSNNNLLPLEKALAFMHGLLCDARKLTHVAYLRRDPVVPELFGIRRVASQSVLSRFFAGFDSAAENLRCFRPLWRWCLERLPSRKEGYTLDLDSTQFAARGRTAGRRGGGIYPAWTQALFASAFGRAGGGAAGGATVVAARQCLLRQQRHGVLFGFMGKSAAPHSLGRGAGRLRLLPAGTAGLVGTVTPALRGGGATEPTHPAAAARRLGLDPNRSDGNGSRRVDVSGPALATPTALGLDPPSGGGQRPAGRQKTDRCAGLSISSPGHQPARQRPVHWKSGAITMAGPIAKT